jgi:hypothetical protein
MEAYYQNGVKHESESDKELMERMNSGTWFQNYISIGIWWNIFI